MLEKDIEKKVCDYAKGKDMLVYKFTSPARRSVPDRLFFTATGRAFLIEFKRTGEKATVPQQREHEKLRGNQVPVFVVDDVGEGKQIIDFMVLGIL